MAEQPAVLFDDGVLLIANKPSGLPTQATRTGGENLYDLLRARYRYVGLHHRLDRPASGLVLFTLDRRANRPIADAFRTHQIEREYAAVLTGRADDTTWTHRLDGKRAVTHVSVAGTRAGLSAAELTLQTGRLHQIRRHAAMAGVPLAGDRRYGGDSSRWWPRLALHAQRLRLIHPLTGEPIEIASPIPEDLAPLWSEVIG